MSSPVEVGCTCRSAYFTGKANIQELAEWRGRLDTKMKGYRCELGDMREKLNTEVDTLREQFKDLKQSLKDQLAETQELAGQESQIAAEWAPKDK